MNRFLLIALVLFRACTPAFAQTASPINVTSLTQLANLNPTSLKSAILLSTNASRLFIWNAGATNATNSTTIIAPTNSAIVGRWIEGPLGGSADVSAKLDAAGGTASNLGLSDGTAKQAVYLDSNQKTKTYDGVLNALAQGIVADGSTANTAAFAAIDASAATNLVVHFPKGRYVAGYSFTNLNLTFEGEGRGTVFIVSASTNAFRFITSNQRIRFKDLQIDMRGTNKTAISATSVASLDLDHVFIQGVGSTSTTNALDGVSFTSPTGRLNVQFSEFKNCERDGVFAWPAYAVAVEHSIADSNGRGGFVTDKGASGTLYDGYGAQKVFYSDNTVTNCQIGFYAEASSTNLCRISILNNDIINCGQNDSAWGYSYAIAAGNHTAGEVRGNYILNFGTGSTSVGYGNGIDLTGIDDDVLVSGNIIVSPRGHGILANNGSSAAGAPHISDNHITSPGLCGIFVYNFQKALVDLNRITNSVQNAIQINTSSRTTLIGNKAIDSSRGTNDAYSGIRLLSSLGVVGIGNEIDSATQLYALEHDATSFPKSWVENRASNFHTAWITNAGGTTGGNIYDGRRVFFGASTPTITSPNAGDIVLSSAATVNARKAWIFGSDSGWHQDWPLGNEALWINTNAWNGTYRFTISSPDANALWIQRSNSIGNALQLSVGSTTNAGGGLALSHYADTDGDGAPNRISYLNFYGLGMAYNNSADQVVFFADQVNRRVGIKTTSPSYELDVTGDINFTGTLRQNGSVFSSGTSVLVNDVSISNPDLKDSSEIQYAVTGTTNVSPSLKTSGVTAGTVGSSSRIPVIQYDNKGRAISATDVNFTVNGGVVVVTNSISGGAVATDASVFNNLTHGTVRIAATGNFTLSNPTNPSDTQQIIFEITQDSTGSRLLTLGSKFHLGSDITTVTLTTTPSKRDRFTAIYHGPSDQWEITGFVRGY